MLPSTQLSSSPFDWCLNRRLLVSFACCWCYSTGTAGCCSVLVDRGGMDDLIGSRTFMSDQVAGSYLHLRCFHWSAEVMKYNFATKVCPDGDTASRLVHFGLNSQILSGLNYLSYMLGLLCMKFHLRQFSSKISATDNLSDCCHFPACLDFSHFDDLRDGSACTHY